MTNNLDRAAILIGQAVLLIRREEMHAPDAELEAQAAKLQDLVVSMEALGYVRKQEYVL